MEPTEGNFFFILKKLKVQKTVRRLSVMLEGWLIDRTFIP